MVPAMAANIRAQPWSGSVWRPIRLREGFRQVERSMLMHSSRTDFVAHVTRVRRSLANGSKKSQVTALVLYRDSSPTGCTLTWGNAALRKIAKAAYSSKVQQRSSEALPEALERGPRPLRRDHRVDLHGDRELRVPKNLHRHARAHVKISEQASTDPSRVPDRDAGDARQSAPAVPSTDHQPQPGLLKRRG
jgi:hypothetical protein